MKRWHLWPLAALIFAGCLMPLSAIAGPPAGDARSRATAADSNSRAGKKYTATALLRIGTKTPYLVFPPTEREGLSEFEIYKATQEQLVKSQYVLNAALRGPEVRALATIRRELERGSRELPGWRANSASASRAKIPK